MKNKIISIGYIGAKTCYFNIERNEAIGRYLRKSGDSEIGETPVEEIDINDEFGSYDIWQTQYPDECDPDIYNNVTNNIFGIK